MRGAPLGGQSQMLRESAEAAVLGYGDVERVGAARLQLGRRRHAALDAVQAHESAQLASHICHILPVTPAPCSVCLLQDSDHSLLLRLIALFSVAELREQQQASSEDDTGSASRLALLPWQQRMLSSESDGTEALRGWTAFKITKKIRQYERMRTSCWCASQTGIS